MKRMSVPDRILLLITALLAAYQVVQGVDGLGTLAVTSYTVAFGVLLVACLLLIILGFEILDSSLVAIVSTMIPLGLSLGLVSEHIPSFTTMYLIFSVLGFLTVVVTRYTTPGLPAVIALAIVHGIPGLLIFGLPISLALRGEAPGGFALVGLGGALIGIGGLLLSFLKTGKPILPRETILSVLPVLLLLMTATNVAGFAMG